MKKKDAKKLTKDQAIREIEKLKKDLFNLRFKKINNQIEKEPFKNIKEDKNRLSRPLREKVK